VRTFIILWLGQIASSVGSSMTYFALTLWVWEQTQSATAIALITFFFQLPQIGLALFSGLIVDRFSRKRILMLSDVMMAICSLSVGGLAALNQLQLWQLYAVAAVYGCFSHLQTLTQTTIIPLMVETQDHGRASSMGAIVEYSAVIVAPALAGLLYPAIGLFKITLIDLITFAIAILTLASIRVPSSPAGASPGLTFNSIFFGFRYIATHSSLRAIIVIFSLFAFTNEIAETLYEPLVLARTNGNAQILGVVTAASGIGGVIGGALFSVWGGFKQQTRGIFAGFIGTGVSKLIFAMGQLPPVWIVGQFCASLHSPLIFSSYMAFWYGKVAPELQGRVFAADHLIGLVVGAIASLIAGSLADRIFEPAMQQQEWMQTFSFWGTGAGSGMALLYAIAALGMILIGFSGSLAIANRRSKS
jgi:MFS transporter, DHA3 family, macrolide efflux protein